jgi:hypothetical protein
MMTVFISSDNNKTHRMVVPSSSRPHILETQLQSSVPSCHPVIYTILDTTRVRDLETHITDP